MTKSLADFEADEFAFLNTSFVINLSKFLNIRAKKLSTSIWVKEYDEKSSSQITHVLSLTFLIDDQHLLICRSVFSI